VEYLGDSAALEFYDMTADRTETNNLAQGEPARLRSIIAQWESWAKRANVLPWIWEPAYRAGPVNAPKAKAKKRAECRK
jgi:hypothetical protein